MKTLGLIKSLFLGPVTDGAGGGGGGGSTPGASVGAGNGARGRASSPSQYDNSDQDFYKITDSGVEPGNKGVPGKSGGKEDFTRPEGDDGGQPEGDNGDQGGQGGQESFEDGGTQDGGEGGEGGDGGEGGEGQPLARRPAQPAKLTLDRESLELLAGMRQQQQQPRQQQDEGDPIANLSPEQKRRIFQPVEVTPEVFAALRSEDPAIAQGAYQKLANATVTNAVAIARVLIARKEREFEARMGPIQEQVAQGAAQRHEQGFYSAYPALSKYRKMVKLAAMEVQAYFPDGREKTQQQVFKEVAELAQRDLSDLNIKIELTKQSRNANHGTGEGNGQRPQGGNPPANRFSTPGRSGGDNLRKAPKPSEADADIYVGRGSR